MREVAWPTKQQSALQSPSCTSTIPTSERVRSTSSRRGSSGSLDFIDARELQLITYGFYIDDEAAKMTVVAVHPDSASLELHLDIGGAEFGKLAHLLTLTAIECYGRPSERALDQLRRKAAALGDGGSVVSIGRFAGFAHLTFGTT
jgi:hypothetical protein